MWNEPSAQDLQRLPRLYETDHLPPAEKIIQEHFFLGSCDWYMSEYDPDDRVFFGYAILNDDFQNSEWGYVSFDELRSVRVRGIEVDRDLHWKVRKASEVERIVRGGGV